MPFLSWSRSILDCRSFFVAPICCQTEFCFELRQQIRGGQKVPFPNCTRAILDERRFCFLPDGYEKFEAGWKKFLLFLAPQAPPKNFGDLRSIKSRICYI